MKTFVLSLFFIASLTWHLAAQERAGIVPTGGGVSSFPLTADANANGRSLTNASTVQGIIGDFQQLAGATNLLTQAAFAPAAGSSNIWITAVVGGVTNSFGIPLSYFDTAGSYTNLGRVSAANMTNTANQFTGSFAGNLAGATNLPLSVVETNGASAFDQAHGIISVRTNAPGGGSSFPPTTDLGMGGYSLTNANVFAGTNLTGGMVVVDRRLYSDNKLRFVNVLGNTSWTEGFDSGDQFNQIWKLIPVGGGIAPGTSPLWCDNRDDIVHAPWAIQTTNVIFYQSASVPTNYIPTSSTSGTNWTQVNLNGNMYFIATNYVSGGFWYQKLTSGITTTP